MTKKQNNNTRPPARTLEVAGKSRRRKKSMNPFATRLSAHVTEEGEWITGPPNLTLSRMFLVVLLLHILIVGGILAFEMFKDEPVAASPLDGVKPFTADRDALSGAGIRDAASAHPVEGRTYRVRSGDTLSAIADRFEVRSDAISALNNLRGDQIFPGQLLQNSRNECARFHRGPYSVPTAHRHRRWVGNRADTSCRTPRPRP